MKTASLTNSKRIGELMPGIKTEFMWLHNPKVGVDFISQGLPRLGNYKYICPAPLADEIWEILPEYIYGDLLEDCETISYEKTITKRMAGYWSREQSWFEPASFKVDTLSDPLCLTLIYLIENKLIEV